MKKLILMIALMLPVLAGAQKIAYMDSQEILAQMYENAKIQERLDTVQGQYEEQIVLMQQELQKKAQEYEQQQATLPDAVKQYRQQELQEMQQRIQTFYQTAQQDIQRKQQEFLAPLQEKLLKATQTVAKKAGYTYVLERAAAVYVADDAPNCQAAVKKELGLK